MASLEEETYELWQEATDETKQMPTNALFILDEVANTNFGKYITRLCQLVVEDNIGEITRRNAIKELYRRLYSDSKIAQDMIQLKWNNINGDFKKSIDEAVSTILQVHNKQNNKKIL